MVKFDMLTPRPPDDDAPPTYSHFDTISLDDPRKVEITRANTAPSTTPYLGLQARLSQVWLNRWTVLLLLVLARLAIVLSTLDDNVGDARTRALAACSKVEDVGSSVASMPHYLSAGVNELAASGVEASVRGLAAGLLVSVTAAENSVLFAIGALTETYAGVTAALVAGSLSSANSAITKFSEASNKTVDDIAATLEKTADDLKNDLGAMVDEIESDIFGQALPSVPDVDFSKVLESLRAFDVDTSGFTGELEDLEGDLPDYGRVREAAERAVSGPFEDIRKSINDSFGGFRFDRGAFSLAKKQRLTFCSDNADLDSFFDSLFASVRTGRTALLVTLGVLALLAMAPAAWLEIKRFRLQRDHARMAGGGQHDPLDTYYLSARPLSSSIGNKLASRFTGRKKVLVRWCVAYATSLPALLVLSLALAGLLSCLCQFVVLRVVRTKVPALAEKVGDFAGEVVGLLQGASKDWAGEANGVLSELNDKMNGDLEGVVKDGTAAVEDALSTFSTEMQRAVEDSLGSALKDASGEISKVLEKLNADSVKEGLSWLQDQASVRLPQLADDAFSLGAEASIGKDSELTTFLASPSSVTTDEVTGAVRWVVERLERGILVELLVSVGLLLGYVIVVLVGVVRVLIGARTPERSRGPGPVGESFAQRDEGGFADGVGGYYGGMGEGWMGEKEKGEKVSSVRAGTATRVAAHARQSSYGEVGSAGRF